MVTKRHLDPWCRAAEPAESTPVIGFDTLESVKIRVPLYARSSDRRSRRNDGPRLARPSDGPDVRRLKRRPRGPRPSLRHSVLEQGMLVEPIACLATVGVRARDLEAYRVPCDHDGCNLVTNGREPHPDGSLGSRRECRRTRFSTVRLLRYKETEGKDGHACAPKNGPTPNCERLEPRLVRVRFHRARRSRSIVCSLRLRTPRRRTVRPWMALATVGRSCISPGVLGEAS